MEGDGSGGRAFEAPRSAVPAINLSRLYLDQGRMDDARTAARRALVRAPHDADAHVERQIVHRARRSLVLGETVQGNHAPIADVNIERTLAGARPDHVGSCEGPRVNG